MMILRSSDAAHLFWPWADEARDSDNIWLKQGGDKESLKNPYNL